MQDEDKKKPSEPLTFLDLNVEELEKRLEMSAIPQALGYLCFGDCTSHMPQPGPTPTPSPN